MLCSLSLVPTSARLLVTSAFVLFLSCPILQGCWSSLLCSHSLARAPTLKAAGACRCAFCLSRAHFAGLLVTSAVLPFVLAGLLVLADVVVLQLAAQTQCSGLFACQVEHVRSLVTEIQVQPSKSGVCVRLVGGWVGCMSFCIL